MVAALAPVSLLLNAALGRSVKVGVYSITNSLSSFSFVGETGAPSLIGADSPLNRSPKILFGACTLSGVSVGVLLVFNLGTYAASDFARECRTLPLRVNAAAAGCAPESDDRNLAPNAGRIGAAVSLGEAITCPSSFQTPSNCRGDEVSSIRPSDPLYPVSLDDPGRLWCERLDEVYVLGRAVLAAEGERM